MVPTTEQIKELKDKIIKDKILPRQAVKDLGHTDMLFIRKLILEVRKDASVIDAMREFRQVGQIGNKERVMKQIVNIASNFKSKSDEFTAEELIEIESSVQSFLVDIGVVKNALK